MSALSHAERCHSRFFVGQLEQRIIVDGVMVSDITKFSLVGTEKLKNNAISLIDPKAPDLMMFGMQFFSSE